MINEKLLHQDIHKLLNTFTTFYYCYEDHAYTYNTAFRYLIKKGNSHPCFYGDLQKPKSSNLTPLNLQNHCKGYDLKTIVTFFGKNIEYLLIELVDQSKQAIKSVHLLYKCFILYSIFMIVQCITGVVKRKT